MGGVGDGQRVAAVGGTDEAFGGDAFAGDGSGSDELIGAIVGRAESPDDGSVAPFGDWGRVSVIVPAKNEAKNLPWVLLRMPPLVDEVIVVDGQSTDGTAAIARAARADVRIVPDPGDGKGSALRAGFAAATGDSVVMLDADGSMDPAEITRYLALLAVGFEVVKGSRFMVGGGSSDITALRRFGNRVLCSAMNTLYRTRFSDLCYGYCAFRRSALPHLALSAEGFEIETEMTVHAVTAGLRICEVPSFEAPRGHGTTHLRTFRDGERVLRTVVQAKSSILRRAGNGRTATPSEPAHSGRMLPAQP
jgi:hypothetical protein